MLAMRRLNGKKISGCTLNLHVALGVGDVDMYILGDRRDGWQYCASGEPFSDLDTALSDGSAGQMVVSPEMWRGMQTPAPAEPSQSQSQSQPAEEAPATGAADGAPTAVLPKQATAQQHAWAAQELSSGNLLLSTPADERTLQAAIVKLAETAAAAGCPPAPNAPAVVEAALRKADSLDPIIRSFIPPPILYACEAEASGW